EPDPGGWRSALRGAGGRPGAPRGHRGRATALDPARAAHAGPRRSWIPRTLRRRRRRARRCVPPGYRLALAAGAVRRSLGAAGPDAGRRPVSVPRPPPRAPRPRRTRTRLRDRRRRSPARAARLPVPGVVGGGDAAALTGRARRRGGADRRALTPVLGHARLR